MADITIHSHNAVHNIIGCDAGIAKELTEYFQFDVPGAQFAIRKAQQRAAQTGQPARFSGWNGKINLFAPKTHKLYVGLSDRLETFAKERGLSVLYDYDTTDVEFSEVEAQDFYKSLRIPEKYEIRYYQNDLFVHGVRKRRGLLLSPTASGKSLIIYLLLRYYENQPKTLIVVPTINLVDQMASDFKDYGYDSDAKIHKITAGVDKNSDKGVWVSTWQSIFEMPKEYFKQFRTIIVDETHGCDAKSMKGIMERATLSLNRFGFTGTLKDTLTHKLVLEGLFGPVRQPVSTKDLMDQKYLSELKIKSLVLQYDPAVCKTVKTLDYPGELDFLINHKGRNRFISNLALSLRGNSILLFRHIDHGKALYKEISEQAKDRSVYLVYGETPGEVREEIQRLLTQETDAIFIASYGTFSTGANIPSLRHVIFGSPYKSRIKVLQSIGRGLRRIEGEKEEVTVYDITDDLTYKTHMNFTLKHYIERIKLYAAEQFKYKIYRIGIK